MLYGILYAFAKNLNVAPVSLLAECSQSIGGMHLHKFFHFPTKMVSAHKLAELALIKIIRDPVTTAILMRLDVLALDECGQLSAQYLAALDIIL